MRGLQVADCRFREPEWACRKASELSLVWKEMEGLR